MAHEDRTQWTCDRCHVIEDIPTFLPGGERTFKPEGWITLRRDHPLKAWDLCDTCSKEFSVWRATPGDE